VPEGDTLARTAAGLRPFLVGRVVTAARTGGPGARPRVDRVIGARIDAVDSIGKHLLILLSNGLELRTHLGMHGSWHRYRPGERWRRPAARARLVLEVEGAVAVCFDAPVVDLFERRVEAIHPALARLGPDLLDPLVDLDEVRRRLRAPERAGQPIGEVLLDQRALAGIGNVIRNETLFIERVDPFATVASLDDATLDRLASTAARILRENAAPAHGPERVTTGRDRRAVGPLWVYGRSGRPCRRCGTRIRSVRRGRPPRVAYWCPTCQST
jgi:endonuclease-8